MFLTEGQLDKMIANLEDQLNNDGSGGRRRKRNAQYLEKQTIVWDVLPILFVFDDGFC